MGALDHDREHEVLVDLHDAVLPATLPVLPEVDLDARSLLGDATAHTGGDWFDAVALPAGRVALVVGDVVGGGTRAAVVKGQLRAALAASLLADPSPADAVCRLDGLAARLPGAVGATVVVAVLDPSSGLVRYVTAGHPSPLVLPGAGGEPRFLPPTGAKPLGRGGDPAERQYRLLSDDLLLLHSDGLVTRPGTPVTQQQVQLAATAAATREAEPGSPAGASVAERVCRRTVERLTSRSGFVDDVTLLVAHRLPRPVPPLRLDIEEVEGVALVRAALQDWLGRRRVAPLDVLALQQAVGELVANGLVHAYPPDDRPGRRVVSVRAELRTDSRVHVVVADRGRWRPPADRGATSGRGLMLAQGFVDDLRVRGGERGTLAEVRHAVGRAPALLVRTEPHGAGGRPMSVTEDDGLVAVVGAVGPDAVDDLRLALGTGTRGGTVPERVDLTGVTLLSSAAVQVLTTFVESGAVTLHAASGSTAQHVLSTVGLDHVPRAAS